MAGFSVVSLMKEDASVISRFIRHYAALGAERIFIYHDGPIDHLAAAGLVPGAPEMARVTLHACDADFWQDRIQRQPAHFEDRLRSAFRLGMEECESPWLFICDADEFIIARIPVQDALDRIPADLDSVLLAPVEAVWGPGDDLAEPFGSTWFRRMLPPGRKGDLTALRLHGPIGMVMRRGFCGHVQGKQFLRMGRDYDVVHQHWSTRDGKRISRFIAGVDPALGAALEMAHFDAIGLDRWTEKFRRRFSGGNVSVEMHWRRRWQMALIRRAVLTGGKWPRRLFARLYGLGPRQAAALEAKGLAFRMELFGKDAP